ncbi:MAG: DNA alkylation repair protein [Muribaculaceae bacterium]|nr:DNA alkylation repair protein [Muribaculaceae bacterium]
MERSNQTDILAAIRKEFFALRNGMIADTLRKGGLEQKYIFGLQLPQIKDLALRFAPENDENASELARSLWSDKECREARILACHLMPPTLMTKEEALNWAGDSTSREESDILAFRLLRHLPFAEKIAEELEASDSHINKYTATAIRRFF